MKKKNEPKISIITLNKKSVDENTSNKGCHCEGDDNCPECRVQPMCTCHGVCKCVNHICLCDPVCKCNNHCPCQYEVPCSNKTYTNELQDANIQNENVTQKKARTFFKIGENKINY